MSPESAARWLFPNDISLQKEYIEAEHALQKAKKSNRSNGYALPAVIAVAIPVVGACAMGALGSAGAHTVVHYVRAKKLTQQKIMHGVRLKGAFHLLYRVVWLFLGCLKSLRNLS
ncbi:hypothetical protein [Austwickia sp. TVS 96-490-7B]|uniref:hypothetical protein n=1 Tax=Austwickia sp. TVS 96-490-7B TaxID=2830843 RepID=UPI001C586C8F|nr:hypothetical protein [Austwickia sp. TVS 96-490-7B]